MSNKSDGGGDAVDDGSTDGGALPDDTPEWAKSLSKDIRGSVDDVRDDVDTLSDRVDDLEKKVDDDPLNERMDDDDFEKRFKSVLGLDDDADTDTIRKAFREQVDDSDGDEPLAKSFEGIFDDDEDTTVDTDTTAKSAGRNPSANIRMPNAEGDD
jgi:hypothetical protein